MHRSAARDAHAVDATPAPINAPLHGDLEMDWRHAPGGGCTALPASAPIAIPSAHKPVSTEHRAIDPRLPTHLLSAILLNGATHRVIGFRGRSSPADQCLEALSSVQQATAPFLQAAADALKTHADWLGGAAVRDQQQRLQELGRHHMKPEEPYHLVALNDGRFYAACSDGTLVIRHPDGQQEIRRCHTPQEASAWISRTIRNVLPGQQASVRSGSEAERLVVNYRPNDPGSSSAFRWTAPRGVRTAEEAVEAFWESCDGDADWIIEGVRPKPRR